MLRQIGNMPAGTLGFEAVGKFDDDDFEETVEPVLRREIAAGRAIRMLYLLGPDLLEYEGDALAEQLKFAARHATSYERVAVVSDQDWLRPALRVLSALVPGQLRAFPLAQLMQAKAWVAGEREGTDHGQAL
ncbi:STAS/SEC14 domain-containing protein [Actinomycetospora cinnamomea]|uniref:SpoIIAA-like protein n=1 Tax=Actinomycetospora cinnamomea TaxID=663609 RepID=A0A2U1EDM6_9PSEU|nr:STAS/SEC14 domain-containing protein [Actinomycetospora cinnamomea]PVY97985.1 SpoIIAA-like protein [Actinomycetospora cinnamomea]